MGALGNALVWLGFAGALTAVTFTVSYPTDSVPVPVVSRVLVAAGLIGLLATLWLPWLDGAAAGTGERLRLWGWEALDQLSLGAVFLAASTAVLVAFGAGRTGRGRAEGAASRATVLAALVATVSALVVGNLCVRLGDPAGPAVAAGHAVAAVVAQVPLVGAAMAWRARVGA